MEVLYNFIFARSFKFPHLDILYYFTYVIFLSNFSGTGALAIFLQKSFNLDITTSDYDDLEIEENIAHNCRVNEISVLPHIKRESSFSNYMYTGSLNSTIVSGLRSCLL